MKYRPYLDFMSDLAYRAGRITLGYFNRDLPPDVKADDTPVTIADRDAEEFLRSTIEKTYPGHAILGEEYGERSGDGRSIRWIVDPIDGTKSFMRGVPLYAVLIGLEVEGIVRVGAAYFPALDEMLCAADGEGCWWNGRRARVSRVQTLKDSIFCYTSWKFERYGREQAWERLRRVCYTVRGWGDAYGYLLVATGRAEAMFDPVMEVWDCGPYPPIFREAGGYFGDWSGTPTHLAGEAMAATSALLPEILSIIQGK